MIGFFVGLTGSGLFLALGGGYFLNIPLWAHIAFFPGFVAGYEAYARGASQFTAKCVGVLTVGVTYALVAVLPKALARLARSRGSCDGPRATYSPSEPAVGMRTHHKGRT